MQWRYVQIAMLLLVSFVLGFNIIIPFLDKRGFASAITYGQINDAITNSWEYDEQEGRYPDMIRLGTSEYYAIVSTGDTGTELDGFIRTIRVWNNNGTIKTSLVDSLEYDKFDGIAPSICLVSGDIYAISYYNDTGNKQTIKTVSIDDADGMIADVVTDTQTLSYDSITTSRSQIIHMSGDLFAVTYSASDSDLWLETINITDAGDISAVVANSREINTTDGIYPDFCFVDSDTVAVVYTGGGSDGYLSTWNITSTGVITSTRASEWEFDTTICGTPKIAKVTGNIFMIGYEQTGNDLYVKTCQINDTGSIWKVWKDTQAIDTTNGDYPTFFNVSVNSVANKWIKGISFSGSGSDVWISTFDVTNAGIIGSEIDTLTFGTDTVAWYIPTCFVSEFYFLSIHVDASLDGWAKTFEIYANLMPTISNPSPANGAVDVATTPQLSVNVSDIFDMLYVNWTWNNSGTWQNFGTNQSVPTYGAIADATTNSWEYDEQEGRYPDMIRLGTSEYYAIVSTGDSGTELDGYIRTIKVWDNNGTIQTSLVDFLEYDTSDGIAPSICLVSGDIYAISYYNDTGNKQTIKTVSIDDADGMIADVVTDTQTLSYDSITTSRSKIINMGSNIFAVVYSASDSDLWLETLTIATNGDITNLPIDSQEINISEGIYPDMCMVDSNTVAIVYDGGTAGGNDGYMSTWNISAGAITNTYTSEWEFDETICGTPKIAKVTGNIFMIGYEQTGNDLYVKTCQINDTGSIWKVWIDTQAIDATNGDYPTFFNVSYDTVATSWIKGISFSGTGSDVWISTFDVTNAGIIGSEIDTLTFGTDTVAWYIPTCFVSDFYFLSIHVDVNLDGWAKTFKIGTGTSMTLKQTNANFSVAGTKYYWRVNVTDGANTNYAIYSFTTAGGGGRAWTTKSSGYNTFSNIASWLTKQSGYNTFLNSCAWLNKTQGYNIFSNQASFTIVNQGWNTFSNQASWLTALPLIRGDFNHDGKVSSSDYTILMSHYGETGAPGWIPEDLNIDGEINYLDASILVSLYGKGGYWNTFGNTASWVNITQGYNTFENTASWSDVAQGWNTFSNQASYNNIVFGWNTFGNNASWVNQTQGWNTFGHNASWVDIEQGWNSFNNGQWLDITQGWNTFGNNASWTDINQGWNTFGNGSWTDITQGWNSFNNTIGFTTILYGWNTFGNTCNWTDVEQGWNTFGNNNFTIFYDWYPKDNDTVDPASFTFMVHIDETNGTAMNVTWEYWDGANWIFFGSNLTGGNGTYYKLPSPYFDLYGHTYRYRVTVHGNQTVTKDVTFFTQPAPSVPSGLPDNVLACLILLVFFGTFLPLGYAVKRRSAGIYLTMAGMIFLGLIAFLPFNPITLILMLIFAGYISMLGIKKTFFPNM